MKKILRQFFCSHSKIERTHDYFFPQNLAIVTTHVKCTSCGKSFIDLMINFKLYNYKFTKTIWIK